MNANLLKTPRKTSPTCRIAHQPDCASEGRALVGASGHAPSLAIQAGMIILGQCAFIAKNFAAACRPRRRS